VNDEALAVPYIKLSFGMQKGPLMG
jgi:hypothetical protein